MNTSSTDIDDAGALEALMLYYRDAGVDVVLEEFPVDRFAESAEIARQREAARLAGANRQEGSLSEPQTKSNAPTRTSSPSGPVSMPAPTVQASQMTVPDKAAFEDARATAAAANTIDELKAAVEGFSGCNLKHSARSTVFADGNPEARLMIIGEAPGRDEDLQGTPFAGRSGQLLDRMLASIGMDRQTTYLTNVLAWRPPGNRMPTASEIELCKPFVERHIALAKPDFLLLLGNVPSKTLLKTDKGLLAVRGTLLHYDPEGLNIPALASLHPDYLLRSPATKKLSWMDLLALSAHLDANKTKS